MDFLDELQQRVLIGDAGLVPLGSAYEVHGRRSVAQMEAKRVTKIIAVAADTP